MGNTKSMRQEGRCMNRSSAICEERADYSKKRLTTLSTRLGSLKELTDYPGLTIFAAGSYGRLEASQYSDIDMFFLAGKEASAVTEPRTTSLRIFGKVIEIADEMDFPKFSNDSEYLAILPTKEMVEHLGGRKDDHENYFTARMLLLLESRCLYGKTVFDEVTSEIINSYFKDYPDHKQTFQPTFLLNDICRYWKTILLNYENKRPLRQEENETVREQKKIRQKVKNFKLKFSRMTTCYASIALLGSYSAPVTAAEVINLTRLTPLERLEQISLRIPETKEVVSTVLDGYAWFIEMTGLPTPQIEEHFSDKQKRSEMFVKASQYGDLMFKLLQTIDQSDPNLKLLRYLVI